MCPSEMTNICGWQYLITLAGIGIPAIIFYALIHIYLVKPSDEKT